MSQQHPNEMYMDYPPHQPSRSPSSARPSYPQSGFPAGFSLPRNTQRPFDSPHASTPLYSDRVSPAYGMRGGMDQMSSVAGLPNGYMLDNNQGWGYNANTVNGPLNGGSRQRNNRRGALPSVS